MTLRPALSLLLIWTTLVTVLPATAARSMSEHNGASQEADGLRFRLSEGKETDAAPPASPPTASASRLSDAETSKLLARLPSLKREANDSLDFKLREGSLPPPRAGETIQAAFAPATTTGPPPGTVRNTPLEIIRFAPQGEVGLAPNLSITFSQPMVAVSSQEEAAANVPVTLTPQPQGKWRWLGTQTLMFQPEAEGGRLPMATVYTLKIPAGTRSALGNALPAAKTFTFSTPPPNLKNSYPSGESQPRDPLMFLEFDQRIDKARTLESLKLQPAVAGVRLRLATAEEIKADGWVEDLAKRALEGRWLVVRAVGADGATQNALPSDTNMRVVITTGAPSAEGPRTTASEQGFSFKTHGPLRITNMQCGYRPRCSLFDGFRITFSNQLANESLGSDRIRITPEIPNVRFSLNHHWIDIDGEKRSNTTYTVTLDRSIKDRFGQTLTGDNEVSFKVTTAEPALFATGNDFVVLDPAGRRAFTVYSLNYAQLGVAIYKVTPEDWRQFLSYQEGRHGGGEPPSPPGQLVSDKIIDVRQTPTNSSRLRLICPAPSTMATARSS